MATAAGYDDDVVELEGITFDTGSRYTVISLIGQGGFGAICSANDNDVVTASDASVAIKKIRLRDDKPVRHCQLILREMTLLMKLKHENIIDIKNVILKPNAHNFSDVYLVQTLMDSDLCELIISGEKLTNDQLKSILYQILCGLKYMHSANVIHRDLKPDNILFNSNGQVKICDFGAGRVLPEDPNEKLTEFIGTLAYAAPEIIMAQGYYSKKVDIWSVGVIFSELIRGEQLFPRVGSAEMIKCIFKLLGKPSSEDCAWISNQACLEYLDRLGSIPKQSWIDMCPEETDVDACILLDKMLTFNPDRRCDVEQALTHEYFVGVRNAHDERTEEYPFTFDDEKANLTLKEIQKRIAECAVKIRQEGKK